MTNCSKTDQSVSDEMRKLRKNGTVPGEGAVPLSFSKPEHENEEFRTAWICLSGLPGLGPGGIRRLVSHFGNPLAVLEADPAELAAVPGIRRSQIEGFKAVDQFRQVAERELEAIKRAGVVVLTPDHPLYPGLLEESHDPPVVLYGLGNIELLSAQSVAIVGSRSATSYGRRVANMFGKALSEHAVTVVSGLALGIDSEAHKGALEGLGGTIGVLGCGIDVIYPRQNAKLYERIAQNGLILSEYPLGTQPEGYRFPARNRIIAGISHGVVVVEAARKSGSLITAQFALEAGRDIFAVPGQVDSCKSEGTHWLVQQGAQLVVHADDILNALQVSTLRSIGRMENAEGNNLIGLEPDALALLQHLDPYAVSRDELAGRASLSPARLSELLLMLELEGHVEILPGDMICRVTLEM